MNRGCNQCGTRLCKACFERSDGSCVNHDGRCGPASETSSPPRPGNDDGLAPEAPQIENSDDDLYQGMLAAFGFEAGICARDEAEVNIGYEFPKHEADAGGQPGLKRVSISGELRDNYFNILVSAVSGKTIEVRMPGHRCIADVKKHVEKEFGVSRHAQQLLMDADALADDRSLASCIDARIGSTEPTMSLLVLFDRELDVLTTLGLGDLAK